MGDDIAASGCKCQFENHVIIYIGQERPPQEEDVLKMCVRCEEAEEAERACGSLVGRQMFGPGEHILPFRIEADGEANLKTWRRKRSDERKAGPVARTSGSDENSSIENYAHRREEWPSALEMASDKQRTGTLRGCLKSKSTTKTHRHGGEEAGSVFIQKLTLCVFVVSKSYRRVFQTEALCFGKKSG